MNQRAGKHSRMRLAVAASFAAVLCAGVIGAPSAAWADSGSGADSATTAVRHQDAESTPKTEPTPKTESTPKTGSTPKKEPTPKQRRADRDRDEGRQARRRPLLERLQERLDGRHAPEGADTDTPKNTPERARPARHLTVVRTEPPAESVETSDEPEPSATATAPIPQPLSPLGKLVQLPGRLVNTVLQVLDITSSVDGPKAPIKIAPPINDALFATFREVERWLRLDRTPPPQPPIPALDYTGPTTRKTPTVAQFLNAAASAYGLGTTPGGLAPFVANGFQMASANILSGMAARAWVTPDGQVVIAYQGTSGGTNLLFNPFIAAAQLFTDLQVVYTTKTPRAFHDALRFAERVQAAAVSQGYAADDIFVTGHSLGGWEAEYVAQQIGLAGIGFESPGMNTTVPGNGRESMFVNIETWGDPAPFMATDLPGLQPFMPPYVPGGGSKPHYGSIVMIGDPAAMTPLLNAAPLWRQGPLRSLVFLADFFGNFLQYHLPGIQAYHLGVVPDPGVVPWLGTARGPVNVGWGELTIPELLEAASADAPLRQSPVAA